jgi:hypothetical protein
MGSSKKPRDEGIPLIIKSRDCGSSVFPRTLDPWNPRTLGFFLGALNPGILDP